MKAPSVRLVQFTDTHLLADPKGSLRGARTRPRLEACLAHARRHGFPVDAVAITGDIVHDEPEGYTAVEDLFASLGVPVLLIAGNHDDPQELRRRLSRPPFQVGGEWHADDWQVLLLESWYEDSRDGEGKLGVSQLARLDRDLADSEAPHAFVFVHHPPVRMDSSIDEVGLLDAAELLTVVSRHARVRGVCWGHAHQSLDLYFAGGVRLMCTPATSMQFKPRSATFVHDDSRPPGYRVIDLQADGAIVSEVIWLEGYADRA
jgi:Icc protein